MLDAELGISYTLSNLIFITTLQGNFYTIDK